MKPYEALKQLPEIKPIIVGVDMASSHDVTAYFQAEIKDAFCIPPRILYSRCKPYLIVDNAKDRTP